MSEPGIGQVQFRSDGYWHVGVYIGNGLVIHFVANEKGSSALTGPGCVKIDRLEDIAQLYDVTEYVDSPDPKRRPNDPGRVVEIAQFFLENPGAWGSYNVATHNCENFAHQCIYGKPPKASDQTKGFLKMAAVGAVLLKGASMLAKR